MTMNKRQFQKLASDLAGSVYDFHQRWGLPPFAEAWEHRQELEHHFFTVITEEYDETEHELLKKRQQPSRLAGEAVDLNYTVLGFLLKLAASAPVGKAVEEVIAKNAAKTTETHFISKQTGKVERRR